MLTATGFFSIDMSECERVVAERRQEGWLILFLPANVISKDDFFDGVRRSFPLDPPLDTNQVWDALSDSLWAGLHNLPDEKIVIVWPNASSMEKHSSKDFAIATEILRELPQSLSDIEMTAGVAKQLLVLRLS
jgi:hypothetical protein